MKRKDNIMVLTWKDAVGTALVAGAALITYTRLKAFSWMQFGGWRGGVVMLLLVGLTACIVIGSSALPEKSAWSMIAMILGGIAFGFIVFGLIFNSKTLFVLLAGDIFILWLLTTLHHLVATKS